MEEAGNTEAETSNTEAETNPLSPVSASVSLLTIIGSAWVVDWEDIVVVSRILKNESVHNEKMDHGYPYSFYYHYGFYYQSFSKFHNVILPGILLSFIMFNTVYKSLTKFYMYQVSQSFLYVLSFTEFFFYIEFYKVYYVLVPHGFI